MQHAGSHRGPLRSGYIAGRNIWHAHGANGSAGRRQRGKTVAFDVNTAWGLFDFGISAPRGRFRFESGRGYGIYIAEYGRSGAAMDRNCKVIIMFGMPECVGVLVCAGPRVPPRMANWKGADELQHGRCETTLHPSISVCTGGYDASMLLRSACARRHGIRREQRALSDPTFDFHCRLALCLSSAALQLRRSPSKAEMGCSAAHCWQNRLGRPLMGITTARW